MELYYVQRKADGQYKSVDRGFTPDRKKAFTFGDGDSAWKYASDEYAFVPLTSEETEQFNIASETVCAECRQPIEEGEPTIAAKAGAVFHARCWNQFE